MTNKNTRSTSHDFFTRLGSRSASQTYAKGESIFAQGDAANAIFRVEKGNVELTVNGSGRKRASLAILRKGDCFGEGCLLDGSPRTCTARSLEGSTIGRISKSAMLKRLRVEPAFARIFTSYLLHRIVRVEDDLLSQLVNSSEKRLARLLVQLTDSGSGGSRSVATVDQAALANAVGTTRSRVSHFMNEFRLKRMIDYNGELQVHKALLTFLLSKD